MSNLTLSQPGTLIHARGREWMVLPESTDELLMARPLGGLDEEITGILPAIERVESASFSLPGRADLGDFTSCRLLRDAARLSTRAAAGPFRSFGRIAIEPRPYQLVPLIMALRLETVRLLIADDVGIGKTIEAAVIARELLDRGEIRRLAVLCPPHLAEQWQKELAEKFHIEAELILSSTIQRLERDLPVGVSVFDRHRFTIVSTDFIKSARRAEDFILKCPEFVIVDEAHGCTVAGGPGRGRQQRFELLRRIAEDESRHLLLVTATPHSGNEDAFRSLLSLLEEEFAHLPTDLDREERSDLRTRLAKHLVQRRRADIRSYLQKDTSFPVRLDKEATYAFSPAYRSLFNDIHEFALNFVSEGDGRTHQRVRYWSALALLRCVSSSPDAAAATLRNRSILDPSVEEEADALGRQTVLDQDEGDETSGFDLSPGSQTDETSESARRKLLEFARRADELRPVEDQKLQGAIAEIKALLKEGFLPVVFCRFVETAEYVARGMREALPEKVRIESVTGQLPPAERETRIEQLVAEKGSHVLVATDCLSEGINLQQHFNAVLHYDLAWNPTRHEQREGRVDRFGQQKKEIRVLTYYGRDNPMDGLILEVLIKKHKKIKNDLGVAVSVPGSSELIAQALFSREMLQKKSSFGRQKSLDYGDTALEISVSGEVGLKKISTVSSLHAEWENAAQREKANRSRFAQHALKPDAVAEELAGIRQAIGRSEDVARFVPAALKLAQVPVEARDGAVRAGLSKETPRGLRQAIGLDEPFCGRFDLPLGEEEIYLGRTSPVVEGLAGWVLDQALDPAARDTRAVAARCGILSSAAVRTRTTLLLARFRYHLQAAGAGAHTILCEEIVPLACTGPSDDPQWLPAGEGERLLAATPDRNLLPTAMEQQLGLLMPSLPKFQKALEKVAAERAEAQLAAHRRVRQATRIKGRMGIQPVLPVDLLGAYLLLPMPA